MQSELIFLTGFIILIIAMLAADLGLFANPNKAVSIKRAMVMSAVWIAAALCFYAFIYRYGHLLHHIDSFSALNKANTENFHHLKLNPLDFSGSLQLYRKNLALEFISGVFRSNAFAGVFLSFRNGFLPSCCKLLARLILRPQNEPHAACAAVTYV